MLKSFNLREPAQTSVYSACSVARFQQWWTFLAQTPLKLTWLTSDEHQRPYLLSTSITGKSWIEIWLNQSQEATWIIGCELDSYKVLQECLWNRHVRAIPLRSMVGVGWSWKDRKICWGGGVKWKTIRLTYLGSGQCATVHMVHTSMCITRRIEMCCTCCRGD